MASDREFTISMWRNGMVESCLRRRSMCTGSQGVSKLSIIPDRRAVSEDTDGSSELKRQIDALVPRETGQLSQRILGAGQHRRSGVYRAYPFRGILVNAG